jgi:hypothetical protein
VLLNGSPATARVEIRSDASKRLRAYRSPAVTYRYPILASVVFHCSLCAAEAGRIDLMGDGSRGEIRRTSFTGKLSGPLPPERLAAVREAVDGQDVRRLFALDREYTPFFCPSCDAIYCRAHWVVWDVFDNDGWHDSIRGRCLKGHERMLED